MRLRPVTRHDGPLLLAWRNDPETRRWSFAGEAIAPETHATWLSRTLESGDYLFVIGEVEHRPVGMTRFRRFPNRITEVSIMMAPEARGRGWGTELLRDSCDLVFSTSRGVSTISAQVKADNLRSRALFTRVGFQETTVIMELPAPPHGGDRATTEGGRT